MLGKDEWELLEDWGSLLLSMAFAGPITVSGTECVLCLTMCWETGFSIGMAKTYGNSETPPLIKNANWKNAGSSIWPWDTFLILLGGVE